jgi:signal transduction histidine kinase
VPTHQIFRLTAAARIFVLVAVATPVLWERDVPAVVALALIAGFWALAQAASQHPELGSMAWTLESAFVGTVCAFTIESSLSVLAALAISPFVAGLHRGLLGVARSVSAQLTALVAISFLLLGGLTAEASLGIFTWTVTGIGVGFIATFVRSTLVVEPDAVASYRYAQSLLRELIDLSDGLSSGLDVNALGGALLSRVRDRLPAEALALYVPRGESLAPLIAESAHPDALAEAECLAAEAWAAGHTRVEGRTFAFSLGESAVIAGTLSERVDLDLTGRLAEIVDNLQPEVVQFDTALLFSHFRDTATADERRRLSREMHDGVAQDIASIGYVVDALAARPASPEQAKQLAALRAQVTAIVAEVRSSVLTLRTRVGESESLGAAVGSVARHLSEVSGVPITVTLDEHTTRLRSEVEAELFRIAQEAMNNAVKHARATAIEVECQVYAPRARISVCDNGRGLQHGRADSYGLKIMRERAQLIDADLSVSENDTGGLTVTVQIGPSASSPDPHRPDLERVTA